jgi:hypothetical protein
MDCFTNGKLPRVRNDGSALSLRAPRHCERSEASRQERLPRLDCFTNGKLPQVRNDGSASSLRAIRHCERSEAIQRESLPRRGCFRHFWRLKVNDVTQKSIRLLTKRSGCRNIVLYD